MICVEISDWKHSSLGTKSFLNTQLHLLSQAYQIWSFQQGNNAYKCTVAAARRSRPIGKRCCQNSATLRSCLDGVCLSINHTWCSSGCYAMRGTDALWPLGKCQPRRAPTWPKRCLLFQAGKKPLNWSMAVVCTASYFETCSPRANYVQIIYVFWIPGKIG